MSDSERNGLLYASTNEGKITFEVNQNPLDFAFLHSALEVLAQQQSDASVLQANERAILSSPSSETSSVFSSRLATPAFGSPSSSSSFSEYTFSAFTPLSLSTSRTTSPRLSRAHSFSKKLQRRGSSKSVGRPSLGERRASSQLLRGVDTPPLTIVMPAPPVFNNKGDELSPGVVPKEPLTIEVLERKTYGLNLDMSSNDERNLPNTKATSPKASIARRPSVRKLDHQLGFALNG